MKLFWYFKWHISDEWGRRIEWLWNPAHLSSSCKQVALFHPQRFTVIRLPFHQFINYNCDLRIHYFCFHHRFKLVWTRQCARVLGVIIQSISKIKHLNILMLYLWTLEHITRKKNIRGTLGFVIRCHEFLKCMWEITFCAIHHEHSISLLATSKCWSLFS